MTVVIASLMAIMTLLKGVLGVGFFGGDWVLGLDDGDGHVFELGLGGG